MTLYPNPTIDHVTIRLPDENLNAFSHLEVYNGMGQLVFNTAIVNRNITSVIDYQV